MIKIAGFFILGLFLCTCSDEKNKANQSFIDPQNKKNKATINEWTDKDKFAIEANCLEDGLDREFCICMIEKLTQNISFNSYIQLEKGIRLANEKEMKLLESLENCFSLGKDIIVD